MIGAFIYFKTRREAGLGRLPEKFPIAVWSHGRRNVVEHRELQEFLAKNPGSTFLIPKEGRDASLEVADRPDGSQAIHLSASPYDDIDNESWYVARANSIEPQYHRYALDFGVAGAAAFATFDIVAIAAPLLALAIVFWRRSRPSATLTGP